jgi:outer membrane protein OmpA-like peptidoglycan-associated protein
MKKFLLSTIAAGALIACAISSNALAQGNATDVNDVVHDFQGNIVTNTFQNCVITKWKSGTYECGADEASMNAINTELLNIYFNFDSAEITPESMEKLDKVVELLASAKTVNSIDIVGYADYLGNQDYNSALSNRRANAVRSYVERKGYMKTNNVSVVALGEGKPVTECGSLNDGELKDCLWRDRRVEIKLNYAK